MMVKCRIPHYDLRTEANLGVMKDQGQFYQVDLVRVRGMATLRIGVKSLRNQNFDTQWDQSVDTR